MAPKRPRTPCSRTGCLWDKKVLHVVWPEAGSKANGYIRRLKFSLFFFFFLNQGVPSRSRIEV